MLDDVMAELKRLLKEISENTGVRIHMQPVVGKCTPFKIDYCGLTVDAYLEGNGKEEAAKLVCYLVNSTSERHDAPEKEEYLKNILLGEGSKAYVYRYMTKYNVSEGECYAIEIVPDRRVEESFAHVCSCLFEGNDIAVQISEERIAVVKFCADAQASVEFGQFLCQSLLEELGVKATVGIGCEVKSFLDVAESYSQAETAVRMSELFCSKGEVHTYREYLLIKMLEDIPQEKLQQYMEQFRVENAQEVFADEEMTSTAEAFLESSLNISETSRNLFMHRNTLMYRLDKIERITGLNIRNFSDAVTFRVITILFRLLQS